MAFMEPEMTTKQDWLELDGADGTLYVPVDVLNSEQTENLSRIDNLCQQTLSDIYASVYSRVLVWSR
jgi:hypothetical protein